MIQIHLFKYLILYYRAFKQVPQFQNSYNIFLNYNFYQKGKNYVKIK